MAATELCFAFPIPMAVGNRGAGGQGGDCPSRFRQERNKNLLLHKFLDYYWPPLIFRPSYGPGIPLSTIFCWWILMKRKANLYKVRMCKNFTCVPTFHLRPTNFVFLTDDFIIRKAAFTLYLNPKIRLKHSISIHSMTIVIFLNPKVRRKRSTYFSQ